jgi:hypothetical protein
MMKTFAIALLLAFGSTVALAADDDDKVPAADMTKLKAALAELGCGDAQGYKKEGKASTRSTMPSAKWARWTSSSTRTSRSSSSRVTNPTASRSAVSSG